MTLFIRCIIILTITIPGGILGYSYTSRIPTTALIEGPLTEKQTAAIAQELANIPGPGEKVYNNTKEICHTALRNQQLLEEMGYTVFYTAQHFGITVIQDFLYMYAQKMGAKLSENFLFLRDPNLQQSYCITTVQQIYDHFKSNNHYHAFDSLDNISTALISASVGLIPNPTESRERAFYASEHAAFFLHGGLSIQLPSRIFASIVAHKINDTETGTANNIENRFRQLITHIKTKTGTLVQIAIPQQLIEKIVYHSHPHGVPRHKNLDYPSELWIPSDAERAAYTSGKPLHEILKDIRLEPNVQVRVVATAPEMLDPKSGVKIIRYDPELAKRSITYEEYRKELEEIVDEVIAAEQKETRAKITEIE